MELKHKVILAYLNSTASMEIPEDLKSKEDPAKQTEAVERLVRDMIVTKLPEFKDSVFSVGGHVRDQLLGMNPKDLDLVVDMPEEKMKSAGVFAKRLADVLGISTANNPHPLKEKYGIWGVVLFNPKDTGGIRAPYMYNGVDLTGYVIEITPPRREGPYDEKKREPSYVEYTTREDDAKRRDLTINAIYKNIVTGETEDYVGGIEDLKNKTLRPPEHPEGKKAVYTDDPLRILRLLRFKGKLKDFKVDPETERTVKDFLESHEGKGLMKEKLSKERIQEELKKILTHPDGKVAVEGLEMMRDYGLLSYISPDLKKMLDMYHDTVYHSGESVWQHTMDVLSKTPPTEKARLGALFHDIGKITVAEKKIDSQGRERVRTAH